MRATDGVRDGAMYARGRIHAGCVADDVDQDEEGDAREGEYDGARVHGDACGG